MAKKKLTKEEIEELIRQANEKLENEYKKRKEKLQEEATKLGVDISYTPEVSMYNIELVPESYWHENRATGLGGSDEGTINGCGFTNMQQLYLNKVLGKSSPVSEEAQFRFDIGHALEWVLLKHYAYVMGYKFLTYNDYYVIVESKDDVSKEDSRFALALPNVWSFKTRDEKEANITFNNMKLKYSDVKLEVQSSNDPKDVRDITADEHKLYDAQGIVCVDRRQYRHPIYTSMLGDCDGLAISPLGERIGLECKTYGYDQKIYNNLFTSGLHGVDGNIGKTAYVLQVQHYMSVCNLDRFDLIAYCGNATKDVTITTVLRDIAAEKSLCENDEEVWNHFQDYDISWVEEQVALMKDDELKSFKAQSEVATESDTLEMDTDEDSIKLIDKYLSKKADAELFGAQKTNAENEANALEAQIVTRMKGHKSARMECPDDDIEIDLDLQSRHMTGRFDTEKFKTAHPDLAQLYKGEDYESEPKLKIVKRELPKTAGK